MVSRAVSTSTVALAKSMLEARASKAAVVVSNAKNVSLKPATLSPSALTPFQAQPSALTAFAPQPTALAPITAPRSSGAFAISHQGKFVGNKNIPSLKDRVAGFKVHSGKTEAEVLSKVKQQASQFEQGIKNNDIDD